MKNLFKLLLPISIHFNEEAGGGMASSIARSEGAPPVFEKQPPPLEDGKIGEQSSSLPGEQVGGGSQATNDGKGDSPPTEGQEELPEPSIEDILAGTTDTSPEHELERVKRDLSASSTEARRLAAENKAVIDLLQEQGLKVATRKNPDGSLVAQLHQVTDAQGKKISSPAVEDLPAKVQDLFVEDSQKAVDHIWKMAQEQLARPEGKPGPVIEPLTQARESSALKALSDFDDPLSGTKPYAEIQRDWPAIRKHIETLPQEFQDAYHSHPELVAKMMFGGIMYQKSVILKSRNETATKTKLAQEEAAKAAGVMPSGEGVVTIGKESGSASRTMASIIAKAE